jgi:hypothetical protein
MGDQGGFGGFDSGVRKESGPIVKRLNSDFVILPLGPSPLGNGDVHESFNVDREGNVTGGHTTVRIPGTVGDGGGGSWNP